ncbi:lipopolysaccharide biosynthesis protein [Salinicoccus hispanicus]|uniref:Oligosaccharide flippase family protein n=1 Tax=Salinicoccus hispanicus TaxID=157225 RepID=A0A6N8TZI8_9STAP|nr:oligosaccharide flippase family protein [Salinicoccus hispanicus]MXQ50973.1 oligosaccharide flippase family protein [Salinicoccus hispanicus]
MINKKTFFKNISWVFSANLIIAFLKWLVLIMIANLLTPKDVGVYSLAFALSAPLAMFMHMKLRSIYVAGNNVDFSSFSKTRDFLTIISVLVLVIIEVLFSTSMSYVILLVGLIKIFDLHSEIYYAIPHKSEKLSFIGKLMVSKHLLSFGIFFVLLYFTRDLVLSLAVQLLVQLIFFFFIEKPRTKRYLPHDKMESESIIVILKKGVPLGLVLMIVSFQSNFPRYVIEHLLGVEVLGYFSAVSYLLVLGNTLMLAVTQTFLPSLSRYLSNKNYNKFKKRVFAELNILAISIGLTAIILCYFLGEFVLDFFYGQEYAQYQDILTILSFSLIFNFIGWNFDLALLALDYINIQPIIATVVLLATIVFSIVSINYYGLYGAAYTMIFTNFLQMILRGMATVYKLKKIGAL